MASPSANFFGYSRELQAVDSGLCPTDLESVVPTIQSDFAILADRS
jgi:hypothetical protein